MMKLIPEDIEYLSETIPEKDSLKLVRKEAEQFYKTHSAEECYKAIMPLYESENFQIQEVGVFLCGYIGKEYPDTIHLLRDTVSKHESWKVQEILAMAFDIHCKTIGYENALPLIIEWFGSDTANVRRAVSEGLRVWTNRPYFKEHPDVAIELLVT
ncbi:DNA alkylation repair protein [Eubacteriales bacterium OttesenSCG-928-A19]|nr:DNA alkylation repair protein [Eubacteriales bacterium OttesenSCG-928-A19]